MHRGSGRALSANTIRHLLSSRGILRFSSVFICLERVARNGLFGILTFVECGSFARFIIHVQSLRVFISSNEQFKSVESSGFIYMMVTDSKMKYICRDSDYRVIERMSEQMIG